MNNRENVKKEGACMCTGSVLLLGLSIHKVRESIIISTSDSSKIGVGLNK